MSYPIVIHPNQKLTRPSQEVGVISDELIQMLDRMKRTMDAHDGIGLAAPQIGKNIRVAIVQLDPEDDVLELINPEIIFHEGENIDVEGCLSLPHQYGTVKRYETIVVRYFDREGDEYELEADDYFARAIQHEIDHLNGILFIDKMIERVAEEDLEDYMEGRRND